MASLLFIVIPISFKVLHISCVLCKCHNCQKYNDTHTYILHALWLLVLIKLPAQFWFPGTPMDNFPDLLSSYTMKIVGHTSETMNAIRYIQVFM